MILRKNIDEEDVQKKQDRLKFLKPVIQKYLKNEQLQITDVTETNLLRSGENYCSIITKLDLTIRKNADAKEDELHLVGKAFASSDKPMTIWPLIFKKELFAYVELLPMYRKLESEAGIPKNDLIDVLPGYVGYINTNGNDEIDNASVLLMENMKSKNCYLFNRHIGLDMLHASRALALLARYHAMGIVMRQKEPSFTVIAIEHCEIVGIVEARLAENYASMQETFKRFEPLSKYLDKIEFSLKSMEKMPLEDLQDPWNTVTHGDFWVNNIIFHKDEGGKIDDVKFVDFQLYLYNSALRDLPYFFCGSLDETTVTSHFDELLDIYYDSFRNTLKLMKCDTEIYNRQNFDYELKKQAKYIFALCALGLKYFTYEVDAKDENNRELHKTVLNSGLSRAYKKKLMRLIEIYESRNWF